jgi:hypothetical protein
MNEIDQLVRDLYQAGAPVAPSSEAIWSSVERLTGRSETRRAWRRPLPRRLAFVFALALAGALAFALLPAHRHSRGVGIPESASAAELLRALADHGSPLPDVPRGSFLYSGGTRIFLGGYTNEKGESFRAFYRQRWELWVGRDGTIRDRDQFDPATPVRYLSEHDRRVALRIGGYREDTHVLGTTTHSLKDYRAAFGMTPNALRRLPTDPRTLAQRLLATAHSMPIETYSHDPLQVASKLLRAPIRPAVRVAMLRALATLPHVRRLPDETLAGEPVVAVAMRVWIHAYFGPGRIYYDHVLLLDPSTGQLVGARFVHRLGNDRPSTARDATVRWTWRQAVVPTIRSRPSAS